MLNVLVTVWSLNFRSKYKFRMSLEDNFLNIILKICYSVNLKNIANGFKRKKWYINRKKN